MTFNVIAQSYHACAYLRDRQIWRANFRMGMHNVQSPNVAKTHPTLDKVQNRWNAKILLVIF